MDSIFALHPAALGSILCVPKYLYLLMKLRFIDEHCLEQRLENVNQTHLVLASGKLVLQKTRN